QPAECAWDCDNGFARMGDACVSAQMVDCKDVAPENATSIVVQVPVTYDEDAGWSEPAECEWACDAGFGEVDGACLDSQVVDCADVAPDNATSEIVQVTITYTAEGGWSEPAECAWACDADFDRVGDACLDTQQ